MKRLGVILLSALALAGCDNKSATASMPEFYVYSSQPYCLAEVTTPEANAETRRKDMFALLPELMVRTQGWREKFTIVGVDYVEFKKFTVVVKGACTDKKAVELARADIIAVNKKLSFTQGGDATLVGNADTVKNAPTPAARFAEMNPDARLEDCLIQFTLPRASEDSQENIPTIMIASAVEFHFPVADVAVRSGKLYMLLARNCAQKDIVAANITAAMKLRSLTDKDFLLAKELNAAEYLAMPKG